MSPTVFRDGSFRFYFFSREEKRMHIHISAADGEAKFWIEPVIELAHNHGLSSRQLNRIQRLVETNEVKIRVAWREHFES